MRAARCVLWAAIALEVISCHRAAQAQEVDVTVLKAADSCQKVARQHALLVQGIINNTMRQFRESENYIKSYLTRWGARVVAGANSTRGRVAVCLDTYAKDVQVIDARLETTLTDKDWAAAQWYDERIFKVLTDVVSEASLDKIVHEVEDHLEPSQQQFTNEVIAGLNNAMKNMKPLYQNVSRCIREQDVRADPKI